MKVLLPYLIGAASTFLVQFLIQFYVVPIVQTRKQRHERWLKDVLDLGELLTTSVQELATEAWRAQLSFRVLQNNATGPEYDQAKVEQGLRERRLAAQQATHSLVDLVGFRVNWVADRIIALSGDSDRTIKFLQASYRYRMKIIEPAPGAYEDQAEEDWDAFWDSERKLRHELTANVKSLSCLSRPPRASWRRLIRRMWRKGSGLFRKSATCLWRMVSNAVRESLAWLRRKIPGRFGKSRAGGMQPQAPTGSGSGAAKQLAFSVRRCILLNMRDKEERQLHKEKVQDLLIRASAHVRLAEDRKPWDYGWHLEKYRHSETAAFFSNGHVFSIDREGLPAYEVAVTKLLKMPGMRETWEPEQFWGIVASGVAYISEAQDRAATADEMVQRLRNPRPSLVALSLANIAWNGPPISFSFGVLGKLAIDYVDAVNSIANERRKMAGRQFDSWIKELIGGPLKQEADLQGDLDEHHESAVNEEGDTELRPCGATPGSGRPPNRPIIWTSWMPGQFHLAFKQAERQLENLIGITLLLEKDIHSHGIPVARGATNRPGVRGITLDRGALESLLSPDNSSELVATTLTISSLGSSGGHVWESADPMPLESILTQEGFKANVEECMASDNPVTRRIKVAARWYTEALWASQRDDAALALGVALDSLIGSRAGLPGRAMSERFAFLEPDAGSRGRRAERYNEIFSVRSAVAHGGTSKRLEEADFVNGMARDVSWAARRLLALGRCFQPRADEDLDKVFEDFRWGTLEWPGLEIEGQG